MSAPITEQMQENTNPHLETPPVRIKAILAATDFSDQATLALKCAARLAKRLHSRLHVLYVVEQHHYLADTTGVSAALQKVEVERAQEELRAYTDEIPEVRTMSHEESALCGPTIEVISAVVETKGIDLVVMGSHGRSGPGKMTFGSVAEAAIHQLHCPVMVTGPNCTFRSGPLQSMVFATDFSAGSPRAAQYTMSIARHAHSMLTVVHVLPQKEKEMPALDIVEDATRELRRLIPTDPQVEGYVHFEIVAGNPAEEILRIAKSSKAELIVMGASDHYALADHASWATLSEVIRGAGCPVLAVQSHLS